MIELELRLQLLWTFERGAVDIERDVEKKMIRPIKQLLTVYVTTTLWLSMCNIPEQSKPFGQNIEIFSYIDHFPIRL